jgi:hypothetical protein
LTPQNSKGVIELATLSSRVSGPIAALAFTADGRELLAVHGHETEGVLRRWRVEDGVLLSTLDVGPVGMAAAAFDAQAQLLAIGAGHTEPAVRAGYTAFFQEPWQRSSDRLDNLVTDYISPAKNSLRHQTHNLSMQCVGSYNERFAVRSVVFRQAV